MMVTGIGSGHEMAVSALHTTERFILDELGFAGVMGRPGAWIGAGTPDTAAAQARHQDAELGQRPQGVDGRGGLDQIVFATVQGMTAGRHFGSTHRRYSLPQDMIATAPKAEIHMHLEGALEPEMLFSLAARNGVPLDYATPAALRAAYRFRNLQEFLDMYYVGLRVLQTEQDFHDLTAAYLQRARQDRVVHAEVFISPQAHLRRGVPREAMMEGILGAFAEASEAHGVTGGLILGAQRHLPEDDALAMLDTMAPYHGQVLGLGLGGAEVGNPPAKFVRLFERARSLGWKTMAHAGEEGPAAYVADSVDLLHVDRIDHGVRCEDDPALVARLAERRIPLTVCPLSNVMLRVVPDLAHHNIARLLRAGLCVTVNSDDPPYFGGYMNDNLQQTAAALGLSLAEQRSLIANGFEAAFLDAPTRARYLQDLDAHFDGEA